MSLRDFFIEKYGKTSSYVSILPDGQEVPWNPLSIREYLDIQRDVNLNDYEKENRIFREKVSDSFFTHNLSELKAGTISTVARSIVENSIPLEHEEITGVLDYYRYKVDDNIFDQLNIMVCTAFPGYTPLQVASLKTEDFFYTVALAEAKLLQTGFITEPLNLVNRNQQQVEEKKVQKPAVDPTRLKQLHEEALAFNSSQQQRSQQLPQQDLPRIAQEFPDRFVVGKDDIREAFVQMDGFEKSNYDLFSEQMVQDTIGIYGDYLQQNKSGVKLTPELIKTPEQRLEEAKIRSQKNEELAAQKVKDARLSLIDKEIQGQKKFKEGLGKKRRPRR
jgi:hypothetical protein